MPATGAAGANFSPVAIVPEFSAPAVATPTIEIELAGGPRMRITGAADPAIVSALIAALAKAAGPR